MASFSKQDETISANGQTTGFEFAPGQSGGTLLMSRHDAAGVTAGTTKLQFKVPGQSNWRDVTGLVTPAQLTATGLLEVDLPQCTLRIDTSSYSGPGDIAITLATNRVW